MSAVFFNVRDAASAHAYQRRSDMTFVVSSECQDCDEKPCVASCAVEAFYIPAEIGPDLPSQVYISPETCIDCSACAGDCQHEAIYPEDELPAEHAAALERGKLCDTERERFVVAPATRPADGSDNASYTKQEYGVS